MVFVAYHSYENNEPQRRRERREKKNLCESVKSVVKFSSILVRPAHGELLRK
jgi:hypothetical protein